MKKTVIFIILILTAGLMAATSFPAPRALSAEVTPAVTTQIPLPEGWTSVNENREIGGWQVAINEKSEGATQLDGEWYPVDPDGCFSDKLLSDEVQKNPEVIALNDSLIQKDVYIYSNGYEGTEPASHGGSYWIGSTFHDSRYPTYLEYHYDGIVWRQELCFSQNDEIWYHMLDVVFPDPGKIIGESLVGRLSVGSFDQSKKYHTFTYYQEMGFEKIVNKTIEMLNKRLVYPAIEKKGRNIEQAFKLWKQLIFEKRHVEITIPWCLSLKTRTLDSSYELSLRHLVEEVPQTNPFVWSNNLSDPEFIQWALEDTNSIKFFTEYEHIKFWYELRDKLKNATGWPIWTSYLKNQISGRFPVWFVRTISIPKNPQ